MKDGLQDDAGVALEGGLIGQQHVEQRAQAVELVHDEPVGVFVPAVAASVGPGHRIWCFPEYLLEFVILKKSSIYSIGFDFF